MSALKTVIQTGISASCFCRRSNISSWLPGCSLDSSSWIERGACTSFSSHPENSDRHLSWHGAHAKRRLCKKSHVCPARPEMCDPSRRWRLAEEFARICEQQQMVSMRWGMLRWENACILTGIPWRPSLRCGMLFLSWDWRVWARMPEGWSSARRRTDFSPLRARLPWLSAHTGPKHWMRNLCSPQSAWFGLLFPLSLSFNKKPHSKRAHETCWMVVATAKQRPNW